MAKFLAFPTADLGEFLLRISTPFFGGILVKSSCLPSRAFLFCRQKKFGQILRIILLDFYSLYSLISYYFSFISEKSWGLWRESWLHCLKQRRKLRTLRPLLTAESRKVDALMPYTSSRIFLSLIMFLSPPRCSFFPLKYSFGCIVWIFFLDMDPEGRGAPWIRDPTRHNPQVVYLLLLFF